MAEERADWTAKENHLQEGKVRASPELGVGNQSPATTVTSGPCLVQLHFLTYRKIVKSILLFCLILSSPEEYFCFALFCCFF